MTSPIPNVGGTFDIETGRGKRRVEFDRDAFRSRDVRVLVDGKSVAAMPYPKAQTPYQEVTFDLDGFSLVGVSWLSPQGFKLGLPSYDLYSEGRSLTDGSTLEERRRSVPRPRPPYPLRFQFIDAALRVGPAAAGVGIAGAIGRDVDTLGWLRAAELFVAFILALVLAARVGGRAWQLIGSDESRSVGGRAALGCLAVSASYGLALLILLAGALLLVQGGR